jgi:hypothetical protein
MGTTHGMSTGRDLYCSSHVDGSARSAIFTEHSEETKVERRIYALVAQGCSLSIPSPLAYCYFDRGQYSRHSSVSSLADIFAVLSAQGRTY